MRKLVILSAACAFLCVIARAQDDQPSLGDVARQSRAQKQQKDAQQKDKSDKDAPMAISPDQFADNSKAASQPKTAHVITNEDIGNPLAAKPVADAKDPKDSKGSAKDPSEDSAPNQPTGDRAEQAEQWKEQIQAQKQSIAQLQRQIDEVGTSIHYAGGNCVQNCEQWNENQQRKQSQVESMKAELATEQQHLEEMQDAARKQGFGSNVYE